MQIRREVRDLPEPHTDRVAPGKHVGPEIAMKARKLVCVHADDVGVVQSATNPAFFEAVLLTAIDTCVGQCARRKVRRLGCCDEPSSCLAEPELALQVTDYVDASRAFHDPDPSPTIAEAKRPNVSAASGARAAVVWL